MWPASSTSAATRSARASTSPACACTSAGRASPRPWRCSAAEATNHTAHRRFETAIALVAAWMMAKDWPDFFPSRRDTYAWRVGVHRRDG